VIRSVRSNAQTAAAIALMLASSGCSTLRSAKLLAPEWFGFTPIGGGLYVETGTSPDAQRSVLAAIDAGRERVAAFFGEATATPRLFACASEACFVRTGGMTSRAKTYGSSHVLISPRGADRVIVAHELSHAELHHRLGSFEAWRKVPPWFDEGLAVLVSEDPRYSEAEWLYFTNNGVSAPELAALGTRIPWSYDNWQLAYGTARKAVGEWYSRVGKDGLMRLIERLKEGADFDAAFRSP
jgi:hypothetical protein